MPLLLPFFKFDVFAWITSEKIAAMTAPHVGSYIMLLAHCWAQATCTLPNNIGQLKTWGKWDEDRYGDFAPVLACFEPVKKTGRLTNPRLYAEWLDARARMNILSESGQKGAAKRWQPMKDKQAARLARPHTNGKTAFPQEWKLTHEEVARWAQHGINPHIEFATFKDHALANDRRCKDWPAAYRNWCRKAITLKGSRS